MTHEAQSLVAQPRDLRWVVRFVCEGTDHPTGVYPPLANADLPRWVWCVLTWTLAVADLALLYYTELASVGFFIIMPMIWWVYTRWWTAVVAHVVFGLGLAAVEYVQGNEVWWVNTLAVVVITLVTGTWASWVHTVRFEAIHALADKEEALAALARAQGELAAAERAAGIAAEREHWAREVHDTLAQGFISVVTLAQTALADLPGAGSPEARVLRGRLTEIEAVARDNLAEARALVAGEAPSVLRDDGLEVALRRLAQSREQHGLDISLSLDLPVMMVAALQVTVLRTVQEAMSNIVRHACARHVDIVVFQFPAGNELVVTVADDGVGAGAAPEGMGLTGMRARVEALGGTLTVDPRQEPDEYGRVGTVVEAIMPL